MYSLGLRPREYIKCTCGTNPIHQVSHGTTITCIHLWYMSFLVDSMIRSHTRALLVMIHCSPQSPRPLSTLRNCRSVNFCTYKTGPVPATFKWGGLTGAGAPEAGLVFQRPHAKQPIIISDDIAHI